MKDKIEEAYRKGKEDGIMEERKRWKEAITGTTIIEVPDGDDYQEVAAYYVDVKTLKKLGVKI